MMPETRDHVSVYIDKILLDLPSTPSKPSIVRVDNDVRCVNENLFDPKVLAIGPFHRDKVHLQKMEQHKFRYMKLLLKRKNEPSVDKYVMAIRSLEEKARRCYGEPVQFSPDEFVQMLVLDGLFIIELIRKYGFDELRQRDDPIFQYQQVLSQLRYDLMLVENQIPFFVLNQLFIMTKSGDPDDDIHYLTQLFVDDISPWPDSSQVTQKSSAKNADHLLGFVYNIWFSSFAKLIISRAVTTEEETMVPVNSAVELQEAGVKFEKLTESNCLDIKFIKGVLKIPSFDVSDETESVFRNLLAYEHGFIDNHPKYVTDYAFFLHCLVNSSKDAEILRRRGIVNNLIGDDEMVYNIFNRLGRNVLTSSDFCYGDVFDKVKRHCSYRKNRWMANLRHNYFNSPWAYMAFFASLMLLLFTLIQAVFSVLSYYMKSK